MDWGLRAEIPAHSVRGGKAAAGSVRLTIKSAERFPLLLILQEDIARVTGIPEHERTENDQAMLATATELLRRLKRSRKGR